MTVRIKDFHNLQFPRQDGCHGDVDKDWCTCDSDQSGMYYLLNDNSCELGDLNHGLNTHEFYFDTEIDCHVAAADYYQSHNLIYPYLTKWREALQKRSSTTTTVDGSQVMEFI